MQNRKIPIFALAMFVMVVGYWSFQHRSREAEGTFPLPRVLAKPDEGGYREKTLIERLADSEEAYQNYVEMRRSYVGDDPSKINPWAPDPGPYLWEYLLPTFSCPHTTQRIGRMGDGGKWVCGLELYEKGNNEIPPPPPCVVYSFGVGKKSEFEAELLQRTDCEIYAFDESVDQMGPEVSMRDSRVHFNKVFISAADDDNTLSGLMKKNNHQFIDFLKMDIEGAEFQVLDQIMDDFQVLPFGQLAVEIHTDQKGELFPKLYQLWERMEAKGLRPFKSEMNHISCVWNHENPRHAEYAFINTKGISRLIN